MIAKHQITLFLPAKMNVACRMKDCELHNVFEKKRANSCFHLWQHIDRSRSVKPMSPTASASPFHPSFHRRSPFFSPLLSEQFQTWGISRSRLRGVAGWNQFHWMGVPWARSHPALFDRCSWNGPEGHLQPFDVPLKTIAFSTWFNTGPLIVSTQMNSLPEKRHINI